MTPFKNSFNLPPPPPPRIICCNKIFRSCRQVPPCVIVILIALWLAFPQSSAPVQAQVANPNPADCGMPLSGNLLNSAIYTLTEDCTLSDRLVIDGHGSSPVVDVEVTINGGNNKIKWSSSGTNPLFQVGRSGADSAATLNLNNLTIDLEGNKTAAVIQNAASGTLNLSNVTLTGLEGFIGTGSGVFIVAGGTSTDRSTVSLSNVLAADNSSAGFGSATEGGFLRLKTYTDATLNNVVIRNNYWNSAAISVGSTSTLTANGCVTFSGVIPRNVDGTWTNNSTGACSGKIGNKGDATLAAPKTLPCGFPATTNFDLNASYSLRGNCVITGDYNLTQGVTVRINGNGHRFTSDSTTPATFHVAYESSLILDNIVSENVAYINFGTLRGTKLHAKDFSRTSVVLNMGQAAFSKSIFSDNVGSYSGGVLNNLHHYGDGAVTITDSIFRNNSGRRGRIADDWLGGFYYFGRLHHLRRQQPGRYRRDGHGQQHRSLRRIRYDRSRRANCAGSA